MCISCSVILIFTLFMLQPMLKAGDLAGLLAQRIFTTTPAPLPGAPTTPVPVRAFPKGQIKLDRFPQGFNFQFQS